MGYTTSFEGEFRLDKPLRPEHRAYLAAFAASRRMARDPAVAAKLPDPVREAVGLPVGPQGGYFVGTADQDGGQVRDDSIVAYNDPPAGQPGLWCQWTPDEDGTAIADRRGMLPAGPAPVGARTAPLESVARSPHGESAAGTERVGRRVVRVNDRRG